MGLKKVAVLLVFVMVAASLFGAGSKEAVRPSFVNVATGSLAGVYYPLGSAVAKIITDKLEGVTAQAESTGASLANVTLLMNGDVELAIIQNDIAYYAFNGLERYAGSGPMKRLRGVAVWYPEFIQIVASSNSGIRSISDLRGKKVAVGAPGSGTEANTRQILAAHGITYADLGKADFLTFTEAAENLRDGHIDAAFQTAGIPTAIVTDIATTKDIVLVPFDEDKIDSFLKKYPFYTRVVIPAGTYPKQTQPVVTVAVMAMLATHSDVDEGLMHDMVEAIFSNLGTLAAAHARGANLKLDTALEGMPIPLHPGAERFFKK